MEEIGSRVGRILVEPIERDFGRKSSRSAWSSMRGRRAIGRAKGPPGARLFLRNRVLTENPGWRA